MINEPRFWIVVIAQRDIEAAVAGGYVEVNHGKAGPLERMQPGDAVACYSPRVQYPNGDALQAFTALGRVVAARLYQRPDLHQPFRRSVEWLEVQAAPIRPLIEVLAFIRNKAYWGAAFRFGHTRVGREDF